MSDEQVTLLRVDTLRCEAPEAEVLEGLLAEAGVVDAVVDLENESVRVRHDPTLVDAARLADMLGFFGLSVAGREARAMAA